MLEATAQKPGRNWESYQALRRCIEQTGEQVSPNKSIAELDEFLVLSNLKYGEDIGWQMARQKGAVLDAQALRNAQPVADLAHAPALTMRLKCWHSEACIARSYCLESGFKTESSRLVEVSFTQKFLLQLREWAVAKATANLSLADWSEQISQHIYQAGFEVIGTAPLVSGYQGEQALSANDALGEASLIALNLPIGIIGGTYAMQWADVYGFSHTGKLVLLGT